MAELVLKNVSLDYYSYNESTLSLRRRLVNLVNPNREKKGKTSPVAHTALKDINIDLSDGDRIGLVGLNGAGKSTLLRAMAGIYEPTRGSIIRNGKVSTIFDLYLGMEDEATGYENMFIAGAVIGLSKKQVQAIVSDVEEFTELGEALSWPIKTYSTGMRVRLAFAIATCTHNEIMLIDEIIGVGDSKFLGRAKDRMLHLVENSNILVLASHAEFMLKDFCNRGLVLDKGQMVYFGDVSDAINYYNENIVRRV